MSAIVSRVRGEKDWLSRRSAHSVSAVSGVEEGMKCEWKKLSDNFKRWRRKKMVTSWGETNEKTTDKQVYEVKSLRWTGQTGMLCSAAKGRKKEG